jgi:hypothetical protein
MRPVGVLVAGQRPRIRAVLAAALVTGGSFGLVVFGRGGVAMAHACPIADLTCVADIVDEAQGAVDLPDEVPNTAQDALSQALGHVQGLIDSLPKGVEPPGGGPGGGGPPSGGPGGGGPSGGGDGNQGGSPNGGSGSTSIGDPGPLGRQDLVLRPPTPSVEPRDPRISIRPSDPTPDAATRLREVATGIAVPLLMALAAVLLFTALQDRLDRREPRLALAPVTGDVVSFE